ncbi:NADP-dependent oxidoreductase [Acerihabitans sp.]|uniref:NADP-dependent oxidoreductase n=1 Tax=Acerihabitans sp. TaxID=2811394 RepID=UPI002EDB13A8
MKAVQFSQYGGPEVLRVVDADEPHAGPGQVRIAVHAAGINPSDGMKLRSGRWRDRPIPLPSGIGVEGAGVVDEIGDGVTNVSRGDAVFGYGSNMMAQYAVLTHWARKPEGLPFDQAGGFPVVVETATRILAQVGVKRGQTLLVNGAAGGVGTAVIQFARYHGIIVIGTASAPKHDYLRGLGAIPTTYGPGLIDRVGELAPAGVNAALDLAGAGDIPMLIQLVGDPSRVLSIADFTAPQHGAQGSFAAQKNPQRALDEAARLYLAGVFRVPLEKTFPLEQTAQAYKLSAAGHVTGKLVITLATMSG